MFVCAGLNFLTLLAQLNISSMIINKVSAKIFIGRIFASRVSIWARGCDDGHVQHHRVACHRGITIHKDRIWQRVDGNLCRLQRVRPPPLLPIINYGDRSRVTRRLPKGN